MKRKTIFVLLALVLLLAACVPSQEQIDQILSSVEQTAIAQITVVAPTQNVDEIVQATFQALTAQAPAAGTTGSISGNLSYPSEGIPPLYVVAFNNTTGYYYWVQTLQNQTTYQIDNLPPGNYQVVAYTLGGGGFPSGIAGGYSQAVPCGLSVDCTDHSLIVVQVLGGQVSSGIDPQDWYAPEGTFPAYPLP